MLRRSLFWGLTLMLAAVLVWLIINGRKEEARLAASSPVEMVKTAKSSPTRVVTPKDLEILAGTTGTASKAPNGTGRLVIRNTGKHAYHNTMLRITYIGSGGKTLGSQSHLIPDTIEPGRDLAVENIFADSVPRGTLRSEITIVYSEFGPAPKTTK